MSSGDIQRPRSALPVPGCSLSFNHHPKLSLAAWWVFQPFSFASSFFFYFDPYTLFPLDSTSCIPPRITIHMPSLICYNPYEGLHPVNAERFLSHRIIMSAWHCQHDRYMSTEYCCPMGSVGTIYMGYHLWSCALFLVDFACCHLSLCSTPRPWSLVPYVVKLYHNPILVPNVTQG